jgi:NAD(P)-dependent dehydrogenase (short-subunit alcohol dehydrogenase family)
VINIEGKHVLVTGATSGIGQAAAKTLADAGAEVTILARNPEKARRVADEIGRAAHINSPQVLQADFNNLDSVRAAAQHYLESGKPLDILLNNAGLINTHRLESDDGYEQTLAVNHLAPFLLTGLLLPRLLESEGARIVNLASDAYKFCDEGINFDDLHARKKYSTFRVYGQSKLANILFTRELASRLAEHAITVNCLHPGAVSTRLGYQNGLMGRVLPLLLLPFFKTPEQGADTAIYLCESPAVSAVSGAYFSSRKQYELRPWARDDDAGAKLWQISEKLVDFNYPV